MDSTHKKRNTPSLRDLVDLLQSNLSSSHRLIEEASSKVNQLILDLSSTLDDEFRETSSDYYESSAEEVYSDRIDTQDELRDCRLQVGSKVVWLVGDERVELGTVQWIGMMHDGLVAGIEFEDPVGNSDGHLDGKKLFTCKNGHGRFVLVRELLLATDFFVE